MKNFKIVFRSLLKNKAVSSINLIGLTLGIIISVLLLSYVRQERNTDTFIKDYEGIHMFTLNSYSHIQRPMVEYFRDKFPGMPITFSAAERAGQVFLSDNNENSYKVNHLLNADSAFFHVFQFDALAGDTRTALDVASKIVLKESLAKKIFGEVNPVGQTLRLSTSYFIEEPVEVSAVLKDFPENTSWQFDAVVPIHMNDKMISWYKQNSDRWTSRNYTSFCRLTSNTNIKTIQSLLETFSQSSEITENISWEPEIHLGLKPYSQLYLHSTQPDEQKHGNPRTLRVLELIAMLILLMACINYVNLVSAQRQKRNKSVAVIKMLGSQRWGVVQLYMYEAGMLLLAVIGLCLLFMPFVLQLFNQLMDTNYTLAIFTIPENIWMITGILFITFLITGLLPGLIFSNYKALWLIKPMDGKVKKDFFRNGLPVLQFSIAIALITCLFVIKKQNDMMLDQDPGYQREQVLYSATNPAIINQSQALVNDLKTIPGIVDITFADADFVAVKQNWGVQLMYQGEEQIISFDKIGVTPNFFNFFGIDFKEGHTFKKEEGNYDEFIFNQEAIEKFGVEDIKIARVSKTSTIIGVVENFNLKSAHYPVMPVGFTNDGQHSAYIYLKTETGNYPEMKSLIAQIEQKWNLLSPNLPFEYRFLNDEWNNRYKKEIQFQQLLGHAGWISIFIACLGLFGLSIFIAEKRTKEIGIRKVNGASIFEVMRLLNKSVLVWLGIAFVIAVPIAYYAMNRWLENFAYKTELSWWIFAVAGLASLLVALLTVSWQSWRAASRNPVEALRYE